MSLIENCQVLRDPLRCCISELRELFIEMTDIHLDSF